MRIGDFLGRACKHDFIESRAKGAILIVVITICTRKRSEMLTQCLISVCEECAVESIGVTVVVVENDKEESCLSVIENLQLAYPDIKLIYTNEPRVGIPCARNRAVDVALAQRADWIAFIDDDEKLEAGWLKIDVQRNLYV